MKRSTKNSLLLFLVLGITVLLTACCPKCFIGSRTLESGFYRLDIDRMTGKDDLTMELTAGDMLEVQFETVDGSIYLEIKEPDGTILYAGNGKGVTEFAVNIAQSGTYAIHVEAHHAKGTINIQQKEVTLK
jgi:major membrane immunogen (membrane-anchored lipoprotein)